MRFVFVEQLYEEIKKGWNVYYSVETPTLDTYNFKEEPKQDPDGESANNDLVIFNKQFQRIALIEFKANNPKEYDYKKDFVKLNNKEEGEFVERFFIEIIKNDDKRTLNNIQRKISGHEAIFRCWSLEKGKEIEI